MQFAPAFFNGERVYNEIQIDLFKKKCYYTIVNLILRNEFCFLLRMQV